MNDGPVPVVLCIDIEPDPRQVSEESPEPWLGYERARPALEALRDALTSATGTPARFAWFLRVDEQIGHAYGSPTWIVEEHGDHLDAVRGRGDVLGLHPHPYRWLEAERAWLSDYGSPETTAGTLRSAAVAFERTIGEPCRLLRYGDGWLDTPTLALAEALGIRVDLTLEPGLPAAPLPHPERSTGGLPDRRLVPRHPYTPDPGNLRVASADTHRTIRELPLTVVRVRERRPWRRPFVPLAPWRDWGSRNPFSAMLDQALAASTEPYLAIAVRTGDWAPDRPFEPLMDAAFRALIHHPAARRFVVCPPEEALELLRW